MDAGSGFQTPTSRSARTLRAITNEFRTAREILLALRLRRVPMNCSLEITNGKQFSPATVVAISKRFVMIAAVTIVITVPVFPQNSELQQKLAAVKQAAAENKQKLLQYQWTETTQLTLKGDPKPPTKNLCQYGPDGKVQKTAYAEALLRHTSTRGRCGSAHHPDAVRP
jgi:hypothetical protein